MREKFAEFFRDDLIFDEDGLEKLFNSVQVEQNVLRAVMPDEQFGNTWRRAASRTHFSNRLGRKKLLVKSHKFLSRERGRCPNPAPP